MWRRLFLVIVLAGMAAAALARDLRVALATHGAVVLSVPDDWRDSLEHESANGPPTITFTPKQGNAFHILVTPAWANVPNTPMPTKGALRELVRRAADDAEPRAVEQELQVIDFSGPAGYGSYVSATDRDPEPDGYKHLTQGMLVATDLRVSFTILVNGNPTATVQQALTSLRTLRREPGKGGH
jgi:hypothetical protein